MRFATAADLPDGVEDADRVLDRASEVVQAAAVAGWPTTDGAPREPWAGVLRRATVLQVEFWAEVGEEHDIVGLPAGTSVGGTGLSVSALPGTLAPRAARVLDELGLRVGTAW